MRRQPILETAIPSSRIQSKSRSNSSACRLASPVRPGQKTPTPSQPKHEPCRLLPIPDIVLFSQMEHNSSFSSVSSWIDAALHSQSAARLPQRSLNRNQDARSLLLSGFISCCPFHLAATTSRVLETPDMRVPNHDLTQGNSDSAAHFIAPDDEDARIPDPPSSASQTDSHSADQPMAASSRVCRQCSPTPLVLGDKNSHPPSSTPRKVVPSARLSNGTPSNSFYPNLIRRRSRTRSHVLCPGYLPWELAMCTAEGRYSIICSSSPRLSLCLVSGREITATVSEETMGYHAKTNIPDASLLYRYTTSSPSVYNNWMQRRAPSIRFPGTPDLTLLLLLDEGSLFAAHTRQRVHLISLFARTSYTSSSSSTSI